MPSTSRFHGVRQAIDTGSATLVRDHAPVGWNDLRHEIDSRMRVLPPNRFNAYIICVIARRVNQKARQNIQRGIGCLGEVRDY